MLDCSGIDEDFEHPVPTPLRTDPADVSTSAGSSFWLSQVFAVTSGWASRAQMPKPVGCHRVAVLLSVVVVVGVVVIVAAAAVAAAAVAVAAGVVAEQSPVVAAPVVVSIVSAAPVKGPGWCSMPCRLSV